MIPLQIPQYGKKSENIFLHLSGRSEKPVISHEQAFLPSIPSASDSRCLAESCRQIPLAEPLPEVYAVVSAPEQKLVQVSAGCPKPTKQAARKHQQLQGCKTVRTKQQQAEQDGKKPSDAGHGPLETAGSRTAAHAHEI